jgi:hypothetical protein
MRILSAAGFDLRLRIEPHDDHDDVLQVLEERRPSREQKVWQRQQNEIIETNRKKLEFRS